MERINQFLTQAPEIVIGYSELNFFKPARLDAQQARFRAKAGWQDGWLAIGTDDNLDPIVLDTTDPQLPVSTAMAEDEGWQTERIAGSLSSLERILAVLEPLSGGITREQRARILEQIQEADPQAAIWYWEGFLENE